MRILFADDDVACRVTVKGLLTRWGHQVILAHDGNEALRVLQGEDSPPIAILDWMMPNRDGVSVCRALSHDPDQRPWVLMLTAKTTKSDLIEALNAGADDFLSKPFDATELWVRIGVGQRVAELRKRACDRARAMEQLRAEMAQMKVRLMKSEVHTCRLADPHVERGVRTSPVPRA